MNINDKHKLNNKLFITFSLWCCSKSGKVQEGLTFCISSAEDYLFIYLSIQKIFRLLCVYAWEYSNENDIYGFDSHRAYILVGGVDNTEVN